jgi:NADH-quinone oxidoreductase subunit M
MLSIGEWFDFEQLKKFEVHEAGDILSVVFARDVWVVDELTAPLIPIVSLSYFLITLTTLRIKLEQYSFANSLFSQAIMLAILSCKIPSALTLLLIVSLLPPWFEIRSKGRCTRVFEIHAGAFAVTLASGYLLTALSSKDSYIYSLGVVLLTIATLMRSGVIPLHCWMTDLIEKASLGTSILFVLPLTGALAVMRLVIPIESDKALQFVAVVSLVTAVYSSGMAIVQNDARRFFCYIFLSNASMVLIGLELTTPIGVTGSLCVWINVCLALTGFGICLRSIEGRIGTISLAKYHGLYDHMPLLAGFFLLNGLALIGFPGTIGFIALELLIEGAIEKVSILGALIVFAAALNGIAILRAYFRIFTGCHVQLGMNLTARKHERFAVVLLSVLMLILGLVPQLLVSRRYHAAIELYARRDVNTTQFPANKVPPNTTEQKP